MAEETQRATVFFDIDGTLGWNDPSQLDAIPQWERGFSPAPSAAVAESIRRLTARGNLAFLCSGRSPHDIHPELRALPFSGMIALSGAYVRLGSEVLRDRPIPAEVMQAIDAALARDGCGYVIESAEDKIGVRGGAVSSKEETPATLEEALNALADHRAYKIITSTPEADALMADPDLSSLLVANRLEMNNSEVGLAENTKRVGIRLVLDRLGADAGTTYGFGDSENDLSLFDEVDVGVAMGNAIPRVKDRAAYVTGSVREDGVATGLAHFSLV